MTYPVCSIRLARVLRTFLGPAFGSTTGYTAVVQGDGEDAWLKIYEIGATPKAAPAEPAPWEQEAPKQPIEQPATEPEQPAMKGGRLSARAAMLCNEGAFQVFMGAKSREEAAELLRKHCFVTSRAHIDHDANAASRLRGLAAEYEAWLRDE